MSESLTSFVDHAEADVVSAEWDVHCHEVAVERCEQELAKSLATLAASRDNAEAAKAVRDALVEKFPAAVRQEKPRV
jgi:hypothetical protein